MTDLRKAVEAINRAYPFLICEMDDADAETFDGLLNAGIIAPSIQAPVSGGRMYTLTDAGRLVGGMLSEQAKAVAERVYGQIAEYVETQGDA